MTSPQAFRTAIPERDSAWSEIKVGIKKQSTVILALIFRDIKARLGRSALGLVWLLLSPMTQVTFISLIWLWLGRNRFGSWNPFIFLGIGFVPYLCIRRGLSSVGNALNKARTLLDYPQVKPIDPLIARFIVEMSLLTVGLSFIFFACWWIIDEVPPMPHPLEFFYVIMIAVTLGAGAALLMGVYGTLYEGVRRFASLCSRPLIFVSGVLHPVEDLPVTALEFLRWNPVLQLVEHARHYALGTSLFIYADLVTPSIFSVAVLGFGMLAYYANRRRLLMVD